MRIASTRWPRKLPRSGAASSANQERGSDSDIIGPQTFPVYRLHPDTGLVVETDMQWGLIPHYAESRPHFRAVHARAEIVSRQRLFREAYRKRRCIVRMMQFYQKDRRRRRHVITRNDGEPLGIAGVWENWCDPNTGEWERSFAILTIEANDLVRKIYSRMPLILKDSDFPRWMGSEGDPHELLSSNYPLNLLSISLR